MNDFGNGVHAVVQFNLFGQFWRKPEMPEGLPPYVGALTCPVAASDLASLPPDFSLATLAIGSFQLGEHPILEMTFSVGDLKVRWLADAKDREVWEDLHMWKEWKVLPAVVGVEQGGTWAYRFYLPEIPDLPTTPGELENYRNIRDEPEPWDSMVEYVKRHPEAYPMMSNRVPSLPTPDNAKRLKVVLGPKEFRVKTNRDFDDGLPASGRQVGTTYCDAARFLLVAMRYTPSGPKAAIGSLDID